ncbi:MAG: c-type cytochrome [Burkholderiaceae bacterium]|jgi:cytochrome c553|nr:c-type cytochrome [Burkholderiaceae bacterium]MEB2320095.1 c-type cytochrome [Pseudomonadota bacterium]
MNNKVLCLAVALTGMAGTASAQEVDRQARAWAATCAACHGAAGDGIPAITGRDAEQIHRTLLEFRNGQRPAATVMHQHAKGYTDDELGRIARAYVQASGTGKQGDKR